MKNHLWKVVFSFIFVSMLFGCPFVYAEAKAEVELVTDYKKTKLQAVPVLPGCFTAATAGVAIDTTELRVLVLSKDCDIYLNAESTVWPYEAGQRLPIGPGVTSITPSVTCVKWSW